MFYVTIQRRKKKQGLVPTLWPRELSEGGQGNEGVGHGVRRVQNTGDVIGQTGFHTADDIRAFKPRRSEEENKHAHPHKKNTNTHMASDL